MPTKSELAKALKDSDRKKYGALLTELYLKCGLSKPSELFDQKCWTKHVVNNGGFNPKKALKIARKRQKDGDEFSASTIVSKKTAQSICLYLAKSGIVRNHVLNGKFRNYNTPAFEFITIYLKENPADDLYLRSKGKIRVGLDREGFINHLRLPTPKLSKK